MRNDQSAVKNILFRSLVIGLYSIVVFGLGFFACSLVYNLACVTNVPPDQPPIMGVPLDGEATLSDEIPLPGEPVEFSD